jgi:preprotein translocase subunit SecG
VPVYLSIAEILVSVALIVVTLLQVKGQGGGGGGLFGQGDYVYRTKRGVEKTLFQLTIVLAALFVIISIVALKIA